jgi:hypothetical protein
MLIEKLLPVDVLLVNEPEIESWQLVNQISVVYPSKQVVRFEFVDGHLIQLQNATSDLDTT